MDLLFILPPTSKRIGDHVKYSININQILARSLINDKEVLWEALVDSSGDVIIKKSGTFFLLMDRRLFDGLF